MKNIRKIVVIVDSINIEDSSGSKANVALINNLAEAGFEVVVYHYTLKPILLPGINCYAIPEIKYSPLYFLSRLQRVLQRKFNIEIASFLQGLFGFSFTFFNDTNGIVKALRKLSFEPDLILTLSKGGSFRPHYALLKLPKFHNKWMAYVHDPYPFHYYPRPYNWVETSYKFKQAFFLKVSEKAKYSAFPSQLLMEWMGSYFPNFLKTGVVIPHQIAKYELQNKLFPDYFDKTKFNLLHAGSLTTQRSPLGLIEGYKLFLDQNPTYRKDVKLILLGNASDHSKMLSDYKASIPEAYIHNGNVAFDTVFNLQMNVAVNIILESKSEISPFLPAKFPHCIAAKTDILLLTPYYSETRRLLGSDYEFWTEVDNVPQIAEIIKKLYLLWKQDPDNLILDRKDLQDYLSVSQLKKTIETLQ